MDVIVKPDADEVLTVSEVVYAAPDGYPTDAPAAQLVRSFGFETATALADQATVIGDDDVINPDLGGYFEDADDITFRVTSLPRVVGDIVVTTGTLFKQADGTGPWVAIDIDTPDATFAATDRLYWVLTEEDTLPAGRLDVTFTYVAVADIDSTLVVSDPATVRIGTDLPTIDLDDANPSSVAEGETLSYALTINGPIAGEYADLAQSQAATTVFVRLQLENGLTTSECALIASR